jgi:hypothetical protein
MSGQCFAHYRDAAAICRTCGRGMCGQCLAHSEKGVCLDCADRALGYVVQAQMQRDARLALRRAGIAVPRRSGDPVFLRAGGHPLLAAFSLGLCIAIALGLGACSALAEQRWGIPRAFVAPALGIAVGTCVSAVLGGASRVAGAIGALLALLAVTAGAGTLSVFTTVSLPGPGQAVAFVQAHGEVALAGAAFALGLAYLAAAGRRM